MVKISPSVLFRMCFLQYKHYNSRAYNAKSQVKTDGGVASFVDFNDSIFKARSCCILLDNI